MILLNICLNILCVLRLSYSIVLPFPPKLPPHLRPTSAPTNSPLSQVVSFSEHGLSTVKSSNAAFSKFGRVVKSANNLVSVLAYDDSTDRNSILIYQIEALEESSSSSKSNYTSAETNSIENNSTSSITYNMRSMINLESNPSEFDNFANSFAMKDNSMVVGANMDSEEVQSAGAVYFISFTESDDGDVIQSTKVYSPDMMKNGMFGTNVALNTESLAVTAHENSSVVHFYQTANSSMEHTNSISWEDICEYISIYVDIDECSSSQSMSTTSFRDVISMNDEFFLASYDNGHIVSFKYVEVTYNMVDEDDDKEESADASSTSAGSDSSSSVDSASAANSTSMISSDTSSTSTSSSSSSSRKLAMTEKAWVVDAIVMAPNMTSSTSLSGFGNTMAASSDYLMVSSTSCVDNQGCVFVFQHQDMNESYKASVTKSWSLVTTLYASEGYSYDNFGASIALSSDGTQALIGAPSTNRTDVLTKSGSVYMFELNKSGSWVETASLLTRNLSSDTSNVYNGCGSTIAFANNDDGAFVGAAFTDGAEGTLYYFGDLGSYSVDTQADKESESKSTSSTSKGSAYSSDSNQGHGYRKSSTLDLALLLGIAIPATIGVLMYLMWDDHKTRAVKNVWYKVQNCFGHRYGQLEEDSVSLMRSRSQSDSMAFGRNEDEEEGIITLSLGNENL